jgi:hypothetical protein
MGIPTRYSVGPTSGTHTAAPTANRLGVYMYAGGAGGGGSQGPTPPAGGGGSGGFGFFNKPITQPFSQPFAVGGAGNGVINPSGPAGGATNFTNVGVVNGGAGQSTPGTAPGAALTYPTTGRAFVVGGNFGAGGNRGVNNTCCANPGGGGTGGVLVVFENTGT